VIRPDDLLAEGARPDGSPRASRGDTRDPARAGGPTAREIQEAEAQRAQEEARRAQEARQAQERQAQQLASNQPPNTPNRVLPNLNPDALRAPSLLSAAGKIVEAELARGQRSQSSGRTGLARGDNIGTFSRDPQILSPNPKGIDFGPYLNQLLTRLRESWYSVMPEVARLGQRGRVDIVFTVTRTGIVKDLQVVSHSGHDALDKGALSAIQLSNPFQQLPAEYETDLKLRIAFLYNMNP
jgi:TonB family protein